MSNIEIEKSGGAIGKKILVFLLLIFLFVSLFFIIKSGQSVLIKALLWGSKKICETTDDRDVAITKSMPLFDIVSIFKERANPELIKNFLDKNNDSKFRYLCMESFYGFKDSMAVEALIKVMMDRTDKLRGQACTTLGTIKDKKAVEPMIELYWRGEGRKNVVWSLGRIGDKRAFNVLMDGLKNGDPELKFYCIRAFEGVTDKRVVPTFIKMLESVQEIPVPSLGVKSVKPYIAIALAEITDERAVPALMKMLKHKDHFHRYAAAKALGQIKSREALDSLIPLAKKGESEAIKAIGKIGGQKAIEMLEKLNTEFKSKPVPYIQKCLKEALKEAK